MGIMMRERGRTCQGASLRLLAWVLATLALAVACAIAPGSMAYAEDGTTTVGGFTLSYSVDDGEAAITGVIASPARASDLSVPSSIGGTPVVSIGESAFESADKLAKVTLQAPLATIGKNAFKSSSITSVSFPDTIAYVPYQCFWGCSSLASVDFAEGATPEYIGTRAFTNCSSLKSIEIPPLAGNEYDWICENPTSTFSGKGNWRIGYQCFSYCTSLSEVSFLPGNPNGCREYLKNGGMQFGNNASDLTIVNYCKGTTNRYSSTATWYFSLNFYESKADAQKDTTSTHPWKRMLYVSDTNLLEILKGTTGEQPYKGSDAFPELPATARDAGMIWGLSDSALSSARATLSQSLDVYPVDPNDMAYGWVTSPEIEVAAGASTPNSSSNDNAAYVRLRHDGTADLSGMVVYAADGRKLDSSAYTLVYEKATPVPRPGSSFYDNVWNELSSASLVNAEGEYRVHAVGVGDFKNTETNTASFKVRAYVASVFDYSSAKANEAAGMAAFAAIGVTASTPKFMVVTPANTWQYALVAAGLSGVGGGQAILTNGADTSSSAYLAIQASGASSIIFLGSEAEITKTVIDKVKQNVGKASYDTIAGSGYEDLAVKAFSTVRTYGPNQVSPYDWGDTAIVVSGTRSFNTLPIAQYAYQAHAPVFFTGSSGSLSGATLSALSSGGFKKVVVAGDSSYVSDAAVASIQSATGIAPERVLNGGDSAYEASKGFVGSLQGAFVNEQGAVVNDGATVVIASGVDASSVIAGAQLASAVRGTLLTVSSSADVKRAERYLFEQYGDLMGDIYVVGDFSGIDANVVGRMQSIWTTPVSYAIGSGDTVESGGLQYQLTSGSSGMLKGVADKTLSNVNASSFRLDGKSYTVGSIAANAFKGNVALKSVSSSASSVDASAFEGCTALNSVSLPSARSIGASAFNGCTALATANLPSASSIGATAFNGCIALTTATAPSVTSIGASAFSGCAKLSSAPLVKASSIGASAFAGCKALKTITASAVSSIGASAFANCTGLTKATLSKATSLGSGVFEGCTGLTSISMPKVKTIGTSAFSKCAKLSSVTGAAVTSIGATAFSGCAKLKTASFTSTSLTKVNSKAFYNCKKLKTLKIKTKKLTASKVGANAFKGMPSSAKVYVPKAKVSKYKTMFVKKGLPKKATVKAI